MPCQQKGVTAPTRTDRDDGALLVAESETDGGDKRQSRTGGGSERTQPPAGVWGRSLAAAPRHHPRGIRTPLGRSLV
eukprot:4830312-Prymnesium_polylepis.1